MRWILVATAWALVAAPSGAAAEAPEPSGTKIVAPDREEKNRFAGAVAASGSHLMVGASHDLDETFAMGGAVYTYRRGDRTWKPGWKVSSPDTGTVGQFGYALGIDGDRMVVTASGRGKRGAAYVFRFDGEKWVQEARLTSPDEKPGYFGIDADLAGDAVVVGDYLAPHPELKTPGAAYVFRRRDGTWKLEQALAAPDPDNLDYFGKAVAIDGDLIAVGAQYENDGGKHAGAAYVFRREGDAWKNEAKLVASDATAFDFFGYPLDLEGDRIAVASPGDDDRAKNAGAVYVYRHDGEQWQREQKITAPDGTKEDEFGVAVSLDDDRLLIGAERAGNDGSGRAYLYRFDGKKWELEHELSAPDGGARGFSFGHAVALAPGAAVVGAYRQESAYGFELPDPAK